MPRLPNQRWSIAPAQPDRAEKLTHTTGLSPLLTQVLINRGIDTATAAELFLDPELQQLPSPLEEFPDLPHALELLLRAIGTRQPIAICGDYDADGMTSTALLLRALRVMGAVVDYAIPSRMQEGYGINQRIIEEFYNEGVGLILTVDNGIAAHAPIARARELGLTVIVTDHHDIPETLPDANAILNPKLIDENSPYCGIAGVGVAYVLAVCLAQCLQKTQDLTTSLIELFTLGTIADLAPLTGVNRRWVRRGLRLLPKSRIPGIQALIQVAGLSNEKELKPEAIGFRLGPRINAIGRLADPQIVIELLTTEDDGRALELAMKCEQVNQLRQRLCELIEQEAISWCEQSQFNPQKERVMVVVQPEWHHGVIGIVASRLVERYGVPVFIGTYEDEDQSHIRGSARGIPEFNVFEALQFCGDILEKYGGHRAAGGFSLQAENLEEFRSRLRLFAHGQLRPEYLKPLVKIDVQASFEDLTLSLYNQMDRLHPCGIENADPVFWTPNVRVLEQQTIGRDQSHLKVTLLQEQPTEVTQTPNSKLKPQNSFKAIAWRWGEYFPLPRAIDIAYKLRLNEWNGVKTVELELVGVRPTKEKAIETPDSIVTEPWQEEWIEPSEPEDAQTSQPPLPSEESNSPNIQQSLEQSLDHSELKTQNIPSGNATRWRSQSEGLTKLKTQDHFDYSELKTQNSKLKTPDHLDHSIPTTPNSQHPTPDIQLKTQNSELKTQNFSPIEWSEDDPALSRIQFYFNKRRYLCSIAQADDVQELRIRNSDGQVLSLQPNQRRGLLGKRREEAQEVDVSHPQYFNLIHAALNALELERKDLLIAEKDRLLAAKDQQIATLTQQLNLLNQELQLSQAQQQQFQALQTELQQQQSVVQDHEAQIAQLQLQLEQDKVKPKPEELKRKIRRRLGDAVWKRLNPHSQRDLVTAWQTQQALRAKAFTAQTIDYSEAGLRLALAVEREVVQPFFKHIQQYLQFNGGATEIGGIPLRARKKYTLGMLPPLLTIECQSFHPTCFDSSDPLSASELYCVVQFDAIHPTDRDLVIAFLNQWTHPIAQWLIAQQDEAAAAIEQIHKLRTLAAQADCLLFEWQFQLLQTLIMGDENCQGVLQAIYAE